MTLSDSFLFNAGWLFFAAWSAIIAGLSIAAFGRDLLPSRTHLDPAKETHAAESLRSVEPRLR
jgi:hypothetical protein